MKLYEKKGITSYIMLWKNNLSFKTTASSWGRCQSAGEGRAWLWPGGTGWSPRHLHRSSSTRDASRPGVPTCLWFPADWPIEGLPNIVLVKAYDYSIIKNMSKNKNNWAGVALGLVDIKYQYKKELDICAKISITFFRCETTPSDYFVRPSDYFVQQFVSSLSACLFLDIFCIANTFHRIKKDKNTFNSPFSW